MKGSNCVNILSTKHPGCNKIEHEDVAVPSILIASCLKIGYMFLNILFYKGLWKLYPIVGNCYIAGST